MVFFCLTLRCIHVTHITSLLLSSIPLYEYTTICLFINLMMDSCVVSSFWLLDMKLLWTFMFKSFYRHRVLLPAQDQTGWITELIHVCMCMLSRFSPPGSSVHGILHKNTGVGCRALLQGIFPTQGLNLHLLCLLHWQAVLYSKLHCQTVLQSDQCFRVPASPHPHQH